MAFADHPTLHPANWLRDLHAQVPRKAARDLWNRLRYGPEAPLSDELIHVDPAAVHWTYDAKSGRRALRRRQSGMILGGSWDQCRIPLDGQIKITSCEDHFLRGVPWEDTPLFHRMLRELAEGKQPDGCTSRTDLHNRYETLDRIFEETQRRGRLLTQAELPDFFRREHGGILVHVGRDGTLLRASGGMHRFAIARILKLPRIPAQLGVVHAEAIGAGHLRPLRAA